MKKKTAQSNLINIKKIEYTRYIKNNNFHIQSKYNNSMGKYRNQI